MAKTFRFAGEIIFKNKLLFSLLVLQFVFFLFFALDCANRLYQIEYPRRVLEGLTAQNFALFLADSIRQLFYGVRHANGK